MNIRSALFIFTLFATPVQADDYPSVVTEFQTVLKRAGIEGSIEIADQYASKFGYGNMRLQLMLYNCPMQNTTPTFNLRQLDDGSIAQLSFMGCEG